jgi:hypothetical protein
MNRSFIKLFACCACLFLAQANSAEGDAEKQSVDTNQEAVCPACGLPTSKCVCPKAEEAKPEEAKPEEAKAE